jgi:hypothetical protein
MKFILRQLRSNASEILIFFFIIFSLVTIQQTKVPRAFEQAYPIVGAISILEDMDFNIINQPVADNTKWAVTKNYNHLSHYQPVVSILYIPILLYKKALGEEYVEEILNHDGIIILNLLLFVFSLLYIKKSLKLLNINSFYLPLVLVFLGTPIFYYSIFQPTNPNFSILLFTSLFIYLFIRYSLSYFDFKRAVILFSILSIGTLIRPEFILFAPVLLYLTVKRLKKISECIYAITPLIVYFILNLIHTISRGGDLLSYGSSLMQGPQNSFNYLFSSYGIIYMTPFYLLIFLGMYSFVRSKASLEVKFLLTTPVVIFIIFMSFVGLVQEGVNSRFLITFFPAMVIVFSYLMYRNRTKFVYFYYVLSLIFIIWHFGISNFYSIQSKSWLWGMEYFSTSDWLNDGLNFRNFFHFFTIESSYSYFLSSFKYAPLIILTLFLFKKLKKEKPLTDSRPIFALIPLLFIFSLYGLDFIYNPKNVEELKKVSYFENKVVLNNATAYAYDDWVEVLRKAICFYKKKNNSSQVKYHENKLEEYRKFMINSIIVDPIEFKENLKKGIYRRSFFEPSVTQVADDKVLTCE